MYIGDESSKEPKIPDFINPPEMMLTKKKYSIKELLGILHNEAEETPEFILCTEKLQELIEDNYGYIDAQEGRDEVK